MKLNTLLLIVVFSFYGCGKGQVTLESQDPAQSKESIKEQENKKNSTFIQGTVTKIIDVIFPSAYAAADFSPSFDFKTNMNNVRTIAEAYDQSANLILDLLNVSEFKIYGMKLSSDDYKAGFVLISYWDVNSKAVAVQYDVLDSSRQYRVEVPEEIVGLYSFYIAWAFSGEESGAVIIRKGLFPEEVKGANKAANLDSITDSLTALVQDTFTKDGKMDSAKIFETYKLNESKVSEQLVSLKSDAETFNKASEMLSLISPAFYKLYQIDANFYLNLQCVPAFYVDFVINSKRNPADIISLAKEIISMYEKKGLSYTKTNYSDVAMYVDKGTLDFEIIDKLQGLLVEFYSARYRDRGICGTGAAKGDFSGKGK